MSANGGGGWNDEFNPPTEEEKQERAVSARNDSNKEFIHLLKEKEAAKTALDDKQNELNSVKGRNFELLQKVEQLEKELAEIKTEKKAEKDAKKAAAAERLAAGPPPLLGASPRKGSAHPRSKQTRRKSTQPGALHVHANPRMKPKKGAISKSSVNVKADAEAAKKAAEVEKTSTEKDTYMYYTEIAEKYPLLRLSVLLVAEKKFVEADVNGDGTIDGEELEKILDSSNILFSKQQIKDIVSEIDKDGSCDLDFIECLAVINRLQQNKKTNLPSTLEQNKSSVCLIQ